ncbi:MAG: 2-amino-4-hydroxy-6-hydroxymethyldihydropteridine diphosphokinase [Kiritimatiellae bacterium]|nr:2-amino-4-hydroxy-6-hydroxymethyldihydropteridine diphosphokinase [Kiritimatiellia bacterium]
MTQTIVSLGSNIEPRAAYMAAARERLAALPQTRLLAASSVLETEPLDVPEAFADRRFLNQLLALETELSPGEFSRRVHEIEDALGRVRTVRNGPRTIDVDIIEFGGLVSDDPGLTLPHPRAYGRDFVLKGLEELAGRPECLLARTVIQKRREDGS